MSTSILPGWISLDSLDELLSRRSGPWGMSSIHDYEEPPLHSYSTVVPDAAPEFSTVDMLLFIFTGACAAAMICAALLPLYLMFESKILQILKPFSNFAHAMCIEFEDVLPLPISGPEIPGLNTSKAEVLENQEKCSAMAAILPPSESNEMRKLKEENCELRKDIRVVIAERDEESSKNRAVAGKQRANNLRLIEITRRFTNAQQLNHLGAFKRHIEMATATQLEYCKDLGMKDQIIQDITQQHHAALAAKSVLEQQVAHQHQADLVGNNMRKRGQSF